MCSGKEGDAHGCGSGASTQGRRQQTPRQVRSSGRLLPTAEAAEVQILENCTNTSYGKTVVSTGHDARDFTDG